MLGRKNRSVEKIIFAKTCPATILRLECACVYVESLLVKLVNELVDEPAVDIEGVALNGLLWLC